jgi:hypothetical protein
VELVGGTDLSKGEGRWMEHGHDGRCESRREHAARSGASGGGVGEGCVHLANGARSHRASARREWGVCPDGRTPYKKHYHSKKANTESPKTSFTIKTLESPVMMRTTSKLLAWVQKLRPIIIGAGTGPHGHFTC